ncbi:aldehyde dehydrogenase [Halococcus agarilyticus]|uniref:aldehyde dehydrogenase n=1 Tax=Halococcus agarilyticus TaxID=1232219 RepID=UPI000677E4C2|nr:aldehyde dehydrogenase [Halococcus agarilyticus]
MDVTNSLYYDGDWHDTAGSESIPVTDPATESTIADVPTASEDEVDAALESVERASGEWAATPARDRGELVRELADLLLDNVDELAEIIVQEQGKPLDHARESIPHAADLVEYMAEWDRRIEGDTLPGDTRHESVHLLRKPYGVVAGVIPWNYPIAVLVRKVAPALVTGNTVVVKPSEYTPLSTIRLFELIDEQLDVPDGVVNLVTGAGSVGQQLVTADEVDMVTMTGHVDTGKAIMRDAADDLKEVALELGGKAPAIVWKDADIAEAVDHVVAARMTNAGQVCTCAERLYVHSDVVDEFVEAYTDAVEGLELGDPMDSPDIGPLVSADQVAKTESAVERAREEGARVVTGGERPDREGYYYQPTIIEGLDHDAAIVHDEVFGPVIPVISVDSADEALELANDSDYGLSSYVYTDDYQLAMRFSEELEFGVTYVNRSIGESWQAHHIGWDESGLGGEDGKYGLLKYTRLKTVYHNYE